MYFVYRTDGNDEISWGCHGEVVGFHGKGDFLFVGAKLTVTDCCDIMRNCYICLI